MAVETPQQSEPQADTPAPRSRRSLLTAGIGGVAGAVAAFFGLAGRAHAAPGGAVIQGAVNDAGGTSTTLKSVHAGQTFFSWNTGNGWAVRGLSANGIGGLFQSTTSTGMAGFTSTNSAYAVVGTHDAATHGTGAAIYADGGA